MRRIKQFVRTSLLALLPATGAWGAVWTENWDSGFSDSQLINTAGGSPWVQAGGSASFVTRDLPAYALSPTFMASHNGGGSSNSRASRPTGALPSDVNVVAQFSGYHIATTSYVGMALTPNATSPTDVLWRDIDGSLSLLVTQGFGLEVYYKPVGGSSVTQAFTNVGSAAGQWFDIRVSLPSASGSQNATIQWKYSSSATWDTLTTSFALGGDFNAANLGLLAAQNGWVDTTSFSSAVPEPASLLIAALPLALSIGRRRCHWSF